MEVDIDVKFIDEHKDLKLAVVSFGCDTEHEKFQDNEFMEGPWYILQNTLTNQYRVFYGIVNFNNKNDYISFIDRSGDTENTMAYNWSHVITKVFAMLSYVPRNNSRRKLYETR